MFLDVSRDVAEDYPAIEVSELIVDNMCMQLVIRPEQFDVIVTTNLFGDIISDLCAGLVGGLGMAPGANVGDDAAIFEAVHGSAPDIAGQGIANPIGQIWSGAMMLENLGHQAAADQLMAAVEKAIAGKSCLTRDMGGTATTRELADHIAGFL